MAKKKLVKNNSATSKMDMVRKAKDQKEITENKERILLSEKEYIEKRKSNGRTIEVEKIGSKYEIVILDHYFGATKTLRTYSVEERDYQRMITRLRQIHRTKEVTKDDKKKTDGS